MADPSSPDIARPERVGALLGARSAVVAGASDRRVVHVAAIENLLRSGLPVWGINPSRNEVLGLPCVASARELPEVPDVAIVLVGHQRVLESVAELTEVGVRTFVLPGLGHEAGPDGPALVAQVAAQVERAGGALLGPNCMGALMPGGVSPWIGSIPPELVAGDVAAVVQSGAVGEALAALGPRVGFRTILSLGGEAALDVADACAALAEDEGTRSVGLFLESVRRPDALRDGLRRLAAAGKPVVCLRVGRSAAGARASVAHTAAVVPSDAEAAALFGETGVVEVDGYDVLVEALEVLGSGQRPAGTRIAVVTYSGGEAALIADHADAAGAPLREFSPALLAQLDRDYPPPCRPGNPLDGWIIDGTADAYRRTFGLLASSGEYDVVLAQIDQSPFIGQIEYRLGEMLSHALAEGCRGTLVVPAILSIQSSEPTVELAEFARRERIPLLRGVRPALSALVALGGRAA